MEREKAISVEGNAVETTDKLDQAKERNESLDRKCIRLREYIAKLTKKCEEWASSYRSLTKDLKLANQEKLDLVGQINVLKSKLRNVPSVSDYFLFI